jgi:uncharacterized phage protein gp47/JayE
MQLTGTVGTTIVNGVVSDGTNKWNLPASVVLDGNVATRWTATCQVGGNVDAPPNTINKISTPTNGWSACINPLAAMAGDDVESDSALRIRQSQSTMVPALSIMEGIGAAVRTLPNVTQVSAYENSTGIDDANGVPGHSISLVVKGGLDQDIGNTIAAKKSSGCGTWGTTPVNVVDVYGETSVINFYRPQAGVVRVKVNLDKVSLYVTSTDLAIQTAISNYINALPIGEDVISSRLISIAQMEGTLVGATYNIDSVWTNLNNPVTPTGVLGTSSPNVIIDFNMESSCTIAQVTINPVL